MKLRNKKTGGITQDDEWDFVGLVLKVNHADDTIEMDDRIEYHSLAELNEEWEDYKEPLIKDPKIHKAVRAWAEANDIEDGITYLGDGEFRSYLNTTIDFAILVNEHRFDLLEKGKEYTVTELCGEEEE